MDIDNKILVTRATLPPLEEYIEEIRSIWDNHWLTNMGEKHRKLQLELENYLDVPYVELMVNGHMALEMTLQAFDLEGEVITTPFTFASTTHAIVRNGLKPVFCDIKEDDYTIDPDRIEELITPKTCAIVPVHVYGNICDTEAIENIAKAHGLKVIYDAAHTFGERLNGVGVGNFGDASVFSFHATKVYNSIEGGCVSYTDEKLGKTLYNLKNFGIKNSETVEAIGANAKMNEFQAAMGLCNLKYIDEAIRERKKIANRYIERLSDVQGIRTWLPQENVTHNYAYFPIVVEESIYGISRDDLYDALACNGIYTRKYFYPLVTQYDCYKELYSDVSSPIAEKTAQQVLTLPIYPDLSLDVVDIICDLIVR